MATAAETNFSPPFRVLESSVDKEQVSITKDEISENSTDLSQIPNDRPPRHLSVVRHSRSSLTDTGAVDLVSETSHESLTYSM